MTLHPRAPKDLLLAPVAAEIDLNLQRLRDKTPGEIEDSLVMSFNLGDTDVGRAQREAWILDHALRSVELHHWQAEITADAARLRLSGGSVSLDLGLSATILDYIVNAARPKLV